MGTIKMYSDRPLETLFKRHAFAASPLHGPFIYPSFDIQQACMPPGTWALTRARKHINKEDGGSS
jgi:hypothetical protein